MSYLFVLIHLVNQFDDNYFDNNDEVRFVYVCMCVCVCVCIYIYIYDLVIPLIRMIAFL